MMGKLHTVSVSMGLETSTYKQAHMSESVQAQQAVRALLDISDHSPTLEIFPTYEAGVDVDVWERDGAEFLKVKVQHAPGG